MVAAILRDNFFGGGDKNEGTVSAIKLKLQRNTTPTWGHSRTSQQGGAVPRRGEGECATHSQHSGPTSFPHERHRELHERWSLASFGMRQLLHGVCSLLAPPPTSFDCQNHKLALPEEASSG